MKLMIAIGLTLSATAAAAQTNTTCQNFGAITNCQTSAPSQAQGVNWGLAQPPPNYSNTYAEAYQRGQAIAAERQRQRQALADQAAADARQEQAREASYEQNQRYVHAGQLIDSGHCDEAKSFALQSGDLDLGAKIAALCSAK